MGVGRRHTAAPRMVRVSSSVVKKVRKYPANPWKLVTIVDLKENVAWPGGGAFWRGLRDMRGLTDMTH